MDFGLIIYALNLASIYALMAIGVSILWSSVGLLNMAHGATFAVSGYGAWLITGFMKPIIIASFGKTAFASFLMASTLVGSALISGAIFGAIIYLLAFLPIHDKPNYAVRGLIITLAINIASVQSLLYLFGPRNRGLPKIFGFGADVSYTVIWNAAPIIIMKSLSTKTINTKMGIYEFIHKIKIVPISNTLSAIGSRILPKSVCQFMTLAKYPSRPSVAAAITNIYKAKR